MFLYARLVCDSIDLLGDMESVREAVDNLPEGLNEASVALINSMWHRLMREKLRKNTL